jgi:hypothetical protein
MAHVRAPWRAGPCAPRDADGDGRRAGLLRRVKAAHGRGVGVTALALDEDAALIATAGAPSAGRGAEVPAARAVALFADLAEARSTTGSSAATPSPTSRRIHTSTTKETLAPSQLATEPATQTTHYRRQSLTHRPQRSMRATGPAP